MYSKPRTGRLYIKHNQEKYQYGANVKPGSQRETQLDQIEAPKSYLKGDQINSQQTSPYKHDKNQLQQNNLNVKMHDHNFDDENEDLSPDDIQVDTIEAEDSVSQKGLRTYEKHEKQHTTHNVVQNPRSPTAAMRFNNAKGQLAKYITVPGATKKPGGSMRGYGTISTTGGPPKSGSMRGYPPESLILTGSVKSGHAMMRSSIKNMHYSNQNGTVRAVPRLNLETTANSQLSTNQLNTNQLTTISMGTMTFRRSGMERKEHYISAFDIEMDRGNKQHYLPGQEITGKVVFDIKNRIEIRFIELLIVGQSSISFLGREVGAPKTKRDVFLSKRSYIIGTPDGKFTSVVTPGHYVSKFKFKLPPGVPQSMKYEDQVNGFNIDVVYFVKTRICDDVGSSSARSTHSLNNLVKVLLSRRLVLAVKCPFDITAIPMALSPVFHSEELALSCGSVFGSDIAKVLLNLDRSCFLAGDEIKINLEIQNPNKQRVKKLTCDLQQSIRILGAKSRMTFVIAHVMEKNPAGMKKKQDKLNITSYDITMSTHPNFLPSILPGFRILHVSYNLIMTMKFASCGGQLVLEVPINIGPNTDSHFHEMQHSVPVFKRPVRFPHFSPHTNSIANGESRSQTSPSVQVSSKYSHGAGSLCCCSTEETLI